MEFLLALQQLRSPALDAVFLTATRLGEEIAVLAPLLLLYWCVDRELGLRLGLTYFASGLANQAAKLAFRVERPFARVPGLVPHERAVGTATGYSFPSGHTTAATSLAMALGLKWPRKAWVWALGAAYVALVGISRMYLGVHTPADVLGGVALTAAMALAVDAALRDCQRRPGRAPVYFAICATGAAALVLGADALVRAGVTPEHQAADAFKTGGAAFGLLAGLAMERKWVRFTVEAPLGVQAVKLISGLAVALALKEGLKALTASGLWMDAARYFLTVLYVVVGHPLLFTKLMRKKGGRANK